MTNQVLKDMLGTYCLAYKVSWVKMLPLVEFTYNNSYQVMIQMTPYKALYSRRCQSLLHWDKLGEETS